MTDFGFKLDCEYEGIDVNEDGWQHHRWTCRLIHDRGVIRTPYRMGMAMDHEPTVQDLLQSLQLDAQVAEYDEYDDVLGDMPYSKARKIADACEKTAGDLRRILGDNFDNFMAHNFDEEDE